MRIYERYTQKELDGFGLKGSLPEHVGIICQDLWGIEPAWRHCIL